MAETIPVEISLEFTPNPNTLKYVLNRRVLPFGTENFTSLEEAKPYSPLAVKLFELEGIGGVMIGPNFLTVTLTDSNNLRELNRQVMDTIKEHLESGAPVCKQRDKEINPDEDELSTRIREIVDTEIRPAVAMDGGDVSFEGFRDGTVYLTMMGACSGCPSASMTLKMGIESRLKQEFDEVESVEQV